jgi:16S rRNA (guanine527-N7)-methyltransferase
MFNAKRLIASTPAPMLERPAPPLTPEAFAAQADVSRETLDRLAAYVELLKRWQARINLVSASTLADVWRRHVLDSAQLCRLVEPKSARLYDIGSGAGFPGLVLAIMGLADVHLIESDRRKIEFLREAARITATKVTLHPVRAETLSPGDADFVTARGCASLPELLDLAKPILKPGGVCIFLKGNTAHAELTEARKRWTMLVKEIESLTDPTAAILRLEELRDD